MAWGIARVLYARRGCHLRRLDIRRRVGHVSEVATARLPVHADQSIPLVCSAARRTKPRPVINPRWPGRGATAPCPGPGAPYVLGHEHRAARVVGDAQRAVPRAIVVVAEDGDQFVLIAGLDAPNEVVRKRPERLVETQILAQAQRSARGCAVAILVRGRRRAAVHIPRVDYGVEVAMLTEACRAEVAAGRRGQCLPQALDPRSPALQHPRRLEEVHGAMGLLIHLSKHEAFCLGGLLVIKASRPSGGQLH